MVNEAALLAGRMSKTTVDKIDFIQAVERSIAVLFSILSILLSTYSNPSHVFITMHLFQGIEKKTARLKGSEKGVVARHEACHAVVGTAVAKLLTGQPRVEVSSESSLEMYAHSFCCLKYANMCK